MDDSTIPCSATMRETSCQSEAELDEFLDAIGWGSAHRRGVVAEEPDTSPEAAIEEAPSSSPKTREARRTEPQVAKGAVARYAFATVLVLSVVFRHPLETAVTGAWTHFTGRPQQELDATALLRHAQFTMTLQPGASADEVRDRVGLPGSRGSGAPFGAEQAWYYTTDPNERGQARTYVVAIDKGKVVRTLEITQVDSSSQIPDVRRASPLYLGDLRVNHEGKSRVLSSTVDMAVLLLGASASIAALPGSDIRVMQPERVLVAKSAAAVELPPASMYWHGVLFPLPPFTEDVPPSVLADDLNWLLEGLGCDGKGKMLHPARLAPPEAG